MADSRFVEVVTSSVRSQDAPLAKRGVILAKDFAEGEQQMKLWSAGAASVVVAFGVQAGPPDCPTTDTLYPLQGDISASVLNLNCSPLDSETLECDTMQIMFTKPHVEDQYTEGDVDALLRDLDEHVCQEVPWDEALVDPSVQEKLAGLDPSQAKQAERLVQLCTGEIDSRRQIVNDMIEETAEQNRKTCRLMILPERTHQFEWDQATGQWRSVVEGDQCGAVTITTLESDDDSWWTYTTRTMITDPDGEFPLPSLDCSFLADEEPLIWAGKGNSIRQNCQIIGESWTR